MNNILTLQLNDTEKIVIEFLDSLDELHCCYDTKILFIQGTHEYLLAKDSASYLLDIFKNLLKAALKNKLQLHKSITQDIGYLWNEKAQDKQEVVYEKDNEGTSHWVGYSYSLWGNTWLYNDAEGNIIFEITPNYLWHFYDPKEDDLDENYIPYEEWIESLNYKIV